ncbi:MAG: hypothetical protein JJD98_01265 [Polaromonas sp.]|nr:hypothetical protein [Polaromonas sp.]
MATENYQPIGVNIDRYNWGDVYTGTAAALIEAKIVAECDLPGQPGNNRLSVTRGVKREPGSKQTRRYPRKRSPDVFAVRIDASYEEQTRRETAEKAELREIRAREVAESVRAMTAELKDRLKATTAAEFLEHLRSLISLASWSVHNYTEGNIPRSDPVYGFRIESDTGNEVVRLLKLAHDGLDKATTRRDTAGQNGVPLEAFQRATHDREFQLFLENQALR